VRVDDRAKDEKTGKVVRLARLICTQMAVDNIDKTINASGPGILTSLQEETPDDSMGPKSNKKATGPPPPPQLMLTRVEFQSRMFSTQPDPEVKTRKSTFHGNITVVHVPAPLPVPADNLDVAVELGKLPQGAMHVKCKILLVVDKQLPGNRPAKYMEAKDNVYCRTNDVYSQSAEAAFDDQSDLLTLRGSPGAPALLYQPSKSVGGKYSTVSADVILYNRKTGDYRISQFNGMQGSQLEPDDNRRRLSDLLWVQLAILPVLESKCIQQSSTGAWPYEIAHHGRQRPIGWLCAS
jgi:hypothetical protein